MLNDRKARLLPDFAAVNSIILKNFVIILLKRGFFICYGKLLILEGDKNA